MGIFAFVRRLTGREDLDPDEGPESRYDEYFVAPSSIAQPGGPSFRTSANMRAGRDPLQESLVRLREAFMPSQPVLGRKMLAGRDASLAQLIEAIEDQCAHVVVYGQRGIGKTSLLRVFAEIAQDADYLVLKESCGAQTRFEDIFKSVAAQIPMRFYASVSPTEDEVELSSGLSTVMTEGDYSPSRLGQILSRITGTRVVVILDEFDRATDRGFHRDVAELMKNLSDSSARVQLIIAGVSSNLQGLLLQAPSVRRNLIGLPLGPLQDAEVREIVGIGEAHSNIRFEGDAAARIVGVSQGLPHLTRVLCHHAGLTALAERRTVVGSRDVQSALVKASHEIRSTLSARVVAAAERLMASSLELCELVARAAILSSDGMTVPHALEEAADSGQPVLRNFLDRLEGEKLLVTAKEEGAGGNLSFADEGLPLLLLLSAHAAEDRAAPGGSSDRVTG